MIPVNILLVEDNPGDVFLTKEAFAKAKISNNIHVAKDGEEALQYLKRESGYEDATRPDIVLLDLNLPKMDGREVLHRIKSDSELRSIPVVILSGSEAEQDILKTYNLHASSYIVKPIDLDQFSRVVSAIENFWFTIVVLPHQD